MADALNTATRIAALLSSPLAQSVIRQALNIIGL